MYDAIAQLLKSGKYTVIESFSLASRTATFGAVPRYLANSAVGPRLESEHPGGLWSHQSRALQKLGAGANVVISTGTASGKSLIFRSHAFHTILGDPNARVVVFYPLKALASDQMRGWQAEAEALGLSPDVIGRIDGSVTDMKQRDAILKRARIIVMTPDVCQAWLMARLAMPVVKAFLDHLSLVIMDEAHTLEGVFGSNFAFLIRRLLVARRILLTDPRRRASPQFVAATATIANPAEQLNELTGFDFELIGDEDDGSPREQRLCAHIASPDGEEMQIARMLQSDLLKNSKTGGFITFIDSRKGVESLAGASATELKDILGESVVMPYRAGYDAGDREVIEKRLQSGKLRGVVSTSALELGIDLPHLQVGLNIGVPPTRKAYRQRLGRIGRASPGAFLVIGTPTAFTGYGTSFGEYHELSIEPSYLYLDNRFMQFAHGRCLVEELEAMAAGLSLPTHARWPEGFGDAFAAAKPGGDRPPEFDAIAQLGGDSPHRGYPLRNVGEINFKIARGDHADAFGDANEAQALRECYPGATYLHMARAWEVVSWQTSAFMPYIKVKPTSPARRTRPRIKMWINAGLAPADVLDGHLLMGDDGFIGECQMQITEKVEGFTEVNSGEFRAYQELRQRNPNLRPRMRNFRTSGLILCIKKEWFREGGTKRWLTDTLSAIFGREYSVLPQDVGSASTNITVRGFEGGGLRGDCIVLFDQTYGSLRLTERAFVHFDHLLTRLETAVQSEGGYEANKLKNVIRRARKIYAAFGETDPFELANGADAPTGYIHAFTPGSRVCYREKGKIGTEVAVIQLTMMDGDLRYQIEAPPKYSGSAPAKRWIGADFLEPSAESDQWEYAWWNVETETYEEPPASAGLAAEP